MSLYLANKALKENLERFVSPRSDPKAYNETIALLEIVKAIEQLQTSIVHVSQQVDGRRG